MQKSQIRLSVGDLVACPSGVYFKYKRIPLPSVPGEVVEIKENYARVAGIGVQIHNALFKRWQKDGTLHSKESYIPYDNPFNLSGRYDAIRIIDGKKRLSDIKTVGDEMLDKIKEANRPRADDLVQVVTYHHALRGVHEDLEVFVHYVARGNYQQLEMPISYGEEQLAEIRERANHLRQAIASDKQPDPIESVITDEYSGESIINPKVIICKYHILCAGEDWYEKAKKAAEPEDKLPF